ncbi:MAG: hydrolase [Parachlamydiaceae bacterium]
MRNEGIRMKEWIQQTHISISERDQMVDTLQKWAAMNTHCSNLAGLETFISELENTFSSLEGTSQRIPLSDYLNIDEKGYSHYRHVGQALCVSKRPEAPLQLLLSGHQDTVFEKHCPFQETTAVNEFRLRGPGVADMKGGILILHKSLELLERLPISRHIGWKVLLTPDEEIGSPSSEDLIFNMAKKADIGLVFEPAFPDGSLVSTRKGSSNFVVIAKGKSAHVGRDFAQGRNAIAAISHYIVEAHTLNQKYPTATLNIGKISGGEASNIVPALASCTINVRTNNEEELNLISNQLRKLAIDSSSAVYGANDGIAIEVHVLSKRHPKPITPETEKLFHILQGCGETLSMRFTWKPTGGVCDGNILAQAHLPTLDTLGAVGGNLHTYEEYIEINSLTERSQLVALFLISLALNPKRWSHRNAQ